MHRVFGALLKAGEHMPPAVTYPPIGGSLTPEWNPSVYTVSNGTQAVFTAAGQCYSNLTQPLAGWPEGNAS